MLIAFLTLSSCLEEPKEKKEAAQESDQYEKVIDDLVGVETVRPDDIKVNDTDVMAQTLTISNSVTQERFRRQITVTDIQKSGNQTQYTFQVKAILRDEHGNPQDPVTTNRTLIVQQTENGLEFFGDGTEYTVFSWDFLVSRRGFCKSFETDTSVVKLTCSNLLVENSVYAPLNVPVKKLSLNRSFEIKDKETGASETGKLHYVIQIASQVQEISKMLSFGVSGLQKYQNNVYQIENCNNI